MNEWLVGKNLASRLAGRFSEKRQALTLSAGWLLAIVQGEVQHEAGLRANG